jgi:hypothetical protein
VTNKKPDPLGSQTGRAGLGSIYPGHWSPSLEYE